MSKRRRILKAKPGQLRAYHGIAEASQGADDMCVVWGDGVPRGNSGYLLSEVFSKDFAREMTERGFDLSTMRFSIMRKNSKGQ